MLFLICSLLFSLAIYLVWRVEARIFLYLWELCAYRPIRSPFFIESIERYFPGHARVLAAQPLLREELEKFIATGLSAPKAHEVDAYNESISAASGPAWRTYYLKVYNGWFQSNIQHFPQTYSLLKTMPEVTCAMFSIMEPGNKISPHCGKMRGILRYQLPLILSSNGHCTISVGDQARDYALGQALMFDDTNLHSVKNATDGYRIILFLDIQKPSPSWVRWVDNFCMWLIECSPKFREADITAR